jgi:hypothetical protein
MDDPVAVNRAQDGLADGKRTARRDSMLLQASMRHASNAEPIVLRVRNLSEGGMMAECGGSFQSGDAVELEIRGIGAVQARIAWRTDDRVGFAFDEQIDPKLARKPNAPKSERIWSPPPVDVRRPGLKIS